MASRASTQAFLYRVVTTNESVEEMRTQGLLRDAIPAGFDSNGRESVLRDFGLQAQVEAKRMGTAYELLYCLENSVRELIESTLIETLGASDWWGQGVPEEIRTSAEHRARDDERAPWHGPRGESHLVYVDFVQLGAIIEANWEHFRDLLGDRTWVTNYFREMNRTRRALAHTGSLTQHDVDWMDMRVRQWLMVVG